MDALAYVWMCTTPHSNEFEINNAIIAALDSWPSGSTGIVNSISNIVNSDSASLLQLLVLFQALAYIETVARAINACPSAYSLDLVHHVACFVQQFVVCDSKESFLKRLSVLDLEKNVEYFKFEWVRDLYTNLKMMQVSAFVAWYQQCFHPTFFSAV